MSEKPNIVFIFADQMRAQAMGCAGDPNVKTPALDRLAGESLNFTNTVSNCPVCTPYRACLLTGQYPLTHGLFMNDLHLSDNGHSIAQELGRDGYDTAWIGKWHLDGHGRSQPIPPERRQGFEYWKVLECTHNYNNSLYYSGDETEPRVWNDYDAYAQTEDAVSYLNQRHSKSPPFALFLSFGPPHDPYDSAPEALKALYPPESLVLRDNVPAHRQELAREQLSGYYAHVTALDKCVDRIDTALEARGIKDNTILVFTSDHGDMLESQWHCDAPQRGARKQVPFDESVLVPLLLRYPGRYGPRARTVSLPLTTPDIMPTLFAMTGTPVPETVEGTDLSPAIDSGTRPDRTGVLIASYHPFADWRTERGGRAYRGIRTERYTFVRDRNGPWLLFDNEQDPYQLTNLVNKAAFSEVQARLDAELQEILYQQSDPFDSPETLRRKWRYQINDQEAIPYGV